MHPQIQAFQEAAAAMKAERYWDYDENGTDKHDFLRALGEVLTEVAYQLDRHKILDKAGLEAYRKVAPVSMPSFAETSAEVILLGALQSHTEALDGETR